MTGALGPSRQGDRGWETLTLEVQAEDGFTKVRDELSVRNRTGFERNVRKERLRARH